MEQSSKPDDHSRHTPSKAAAGFRMRGSDRVFQGEEGPDDRRSLRLRAVRHANPPSLPQPIADVDHSHAAHPRHLHA
eukprot:1457323-Rhodomonas_salina.1